MKKLPHSNLQPPSDLPLGRNPPITIYFTNLEWFVDVGKNYLWFHAGKTFSSLFAPVSNELPRGIKGQILVLMPTSF